MRTIALALLLPGTTFAANQTYTFTGTASGTLNGTPFTVAPFTVTAVGDPTTVNCSGSSGNVCVLVLNAGASSFSIGGVGGGTFTASTQLQDNHVADGGVVSFGFTTGVDAIELEDTLSGNTAFATYNLQSLFGPSLPQDVNLADGFSGGTPTSAGNLTVTSLVNYTFQVTAGGVTPTPTPTPTPAPSAAPAPATFILTGLGLAALVLWKFGGRGRSAGGTV